MKGRTGILLLWVLVAIVVVSILLALVAYGPTPTATPTQPPVVEETPTQPPAVVEETPTQPSVEEENVLIYADPATWKDIDPHSAYSDEPHILASVYEPLVWYNPPGSAEMLSPGPGHQLGVQ